MASIAIPGSLSAQQATFALQSQPGDYTLVSVDEGTLLPSISLSSAVFLPFRLAGFSQRDRLRRDIPVLLGRDGPAPHVRLPELGSLYMADGPDATRLLRIDAGGAMSVLYIARHLAGVSRLDEWISVSPSGEHVLVATRAGAGGRVVLLDVAANGGSIDLTRTLTALDVDGESLRLGPGDAWFIAGGSLYHSDLVTPTRKLDLGLLPGETLLTETAMSLNGQTLAVVVEDGAGLRNIVTVNTAGGLTRATPTSMDYDEPSYELPIGPLLALSDDGSTVAWRRTVLTKELFTCKLTTTSPPEQITRDALFTDTIDNVGVMGFTPGGLLVFAAGETTTDPDLAIGGADLYIVDTTGASVGSPQNLTQTSGEAISPFLVHGDLEIKELFLDPRGERLIFTVDPINGADDGLHTVSLRNAGDYQQILPQLAGPAQIHSAGDSILIVTTPEVPTTLLHEVYLLTPEADPAGLVLIGGTSAASVTFDRFTSNRRGNLAAFAANLGPGMSVAVRVDVKARAMAAAWPQVLSLSPTMAFTPLGHLVMGLGAPGAVDGPFQWMGFRRPSVPTAYPIPASAGFPLDN